MCCVMELVPFLHALFVLRAAELVVLFVPGQHQTAHFESITDESVGCMPTVACRMIWRRPFPAAMPGGGRQARARARASVQACNRAYVRKPACVSCDGPTCSRNLVYYGSTHACAFCSTCAATSCLAARCHPLRCLREVMFHPRQQNMGIISRQIDRCTLPPLPASSGARGAPAKVLVRLLVVHMFAL
jgi:hypothetical protein